MSEIKQPEQPGWYWMSWESSIEGLAWSVIEVFPASISGELLVARAGNDDLMTIAELIEWANKSNAKVSFWVCQRPAGT